MGFLRLRWYSLTKAALLVFLAGATGAGVIPADLRRQFEVFLRVSTTHRRYLFPNGSHRLLPRLQGPLQPFPLLEEYLIEPHQVFR